MRKSWYKKSLVIGIIILFIGAGIFPVISGKTNTNLKVNDNQEKTIITIYAFGDSWKKDKQIEISTEEAHEIYDIFIDFKTEIKQRPFSENTQILKNTLVNLIDEKGLLPEGITKKDYLSLLTPNWLINPQTQDVSFKIYRLLGNLINTIKNPIFSKIFYILKNKLFNTNSPELNPGMIGTANYCSIAGTGYGSTHPIFITPRPRILLIWRAHIGDTWVGEIFSNRGFYAWGTQIGIAFGFTGGGMTIGFPPGNLFGFYGYAWYTSINANYIKYNT